MCSRGQLVWPQWERMNLILWKLDALGKREAGGIELGVGGQVGGHGMKNSGRREQEGAQLLECK